MHKYTLSALVALLSALGAQTICAQGQSSGEDTQRREKQQQQQSQYGSSTSSTTPSSQGGNFDVKSSTSPGSGAPGQAAASSGQSSQYSSQSAQTSQGSPATGQSSTSAAGRPGDIQSGANVQVNQQHVTQFQNVFTNWRPGANQEQQFTAAINASAPGVRINHEYITRFVTDYNAIVPRVHLSATAQQRLATAFATVLTPTVQVTTLEPTLTEVRQVLVESGLSPIQAQTVACDLHLMAAQVHPDILQVEVTK